MRLFPCIGYHALSRSSIQYYLLSPNHLIFRNYAKILGIETSCDDTGCAVVNENGEILGENLHSQNLIHLRNGGIIPDVAQDLHRKYIEPTVHETLEAAQLHWSDISAIAVTLEPGLPLSLAVGMKYAKHLSRKYKIPLIPIHHMEAHALIARMQYEILFPFLTLLISGGHCLLAIVKDVNKFQLLGESIDCAPGEVFDKVARRMKLRNIPEYSQLCGGRAVELAASKATNPHIFQLPLPFAEYKDCNFSFNGLKTSVMYQLYRKEKEHTITADNLIPEANDLCAALLMAISRHLVHRTQRAMDFCQRNKLIPDNKKQFVVSGGVACNNYIFNTLTELCYEFDYQIYRPPPKLCTDNGIMIAWNGVEKWQKKIDIVTDVNSLDIKAVSPLGESLISRVKEARITTKLLKIKVNLVYIICFILTKIYYEIASGHRVTLVKLQKLIKLMQKCFYLSSNMLSRPIFSTDFDEIMTFYSSKLEFPRESKNLDPREVASIVYCN